VSRSLRSAVPPQRAGACVQAYTILTVYAAARLNTCLRVSGTAFKEAFGDATEQKTPGSESTFLTGSLVSVGMEEEQVQDERVFRRKEALAVLCASLISDLEQELPSLAAAANRRRLELGGAGGGATGGGAFVGDSPVAGRERGRQGERCDMGMEGLVANRIMKECRGRVDAMLADEAMLEDACLYDQVLGHVSLLRSMALAKWQYFLTVPSLGFSDLDAVPLQV
jgi:hypothetical protein